MPDDKKKIKVCVFDLDGTLWNGTLLEGDTLVLKGGIAEVIRELDSRGILLSIASLNDRERAWEQVSAFGLGEYFLAPQIGWNAKSEMIAAIAKDLNLGLDTFAFLDDREEQREEVRFSHPEVRVFDAAEYRNILDNADFQPRFVTEDSSRRREMYRQDLARRAQEKNFTGGNEAFLRTLNMRLTVAPVREGDLERVEELTVRTNQLNSTGRTYDYDELVRLIHSPNHIFLIASLDDRFGDYGKIGLVLCEKTEDALCIRLLLMSCRVMTRGIGSALLVHLTKLAAARRLALRADFQGTSRNRIMYITYKLMGFEEIEREGDFCVLEYRGEERTYPDYLEINASEEQL
ncbi:MAG: HAD-IIIC family phosphatase [Clostridiaceae bacterium]|nr:HAD-IIIC family phosphatase [Clostridiaceae bacterium]